MLIFSQIDKKKMRPYTLHYTALALTVFGNYSVSMNLAEIQCNYVQWR